MKQYRCPRVFAIILMVVVFFAPVFITVGYAGKSKTVKDLILLLADKENYSDALSNLTKHKDPTVTDHLLKALEHKNPDIRKFSVSVLADRKESRAVEPVIALLKDKSSEVRIFTAYALGTLDDARAIKPLIASLKDKNSRVKKGGNQFSSPNEILGSGCFYRRSFEG